MVLPLQQGQSSPRNGQQLQDHLPEESFWQALETNHTAEDNQQTDSAGFTAKRSFLIKWDGAHVPQATGSLSFFLILVSPSIASRA